MFFFFPSQTSCEAVSDLSNAQNTHLGIPPHTRTHESRSVFSNRMWVGVPTIQRDIRLTEVLLKSRVMHRLLSTHPPPFMHWTWGVFRYVLRFVIDVRYLHTGLPRVIPTAQREGSQRGGQASRRRRRGRNGTGGGVSWHRLRESKWNRLCMQQKQVIQNFIIEILSFALRINETKRWRFCYHHEMSTMWLLCNNTHGVAEAAWNGGSQLESQTAVCRGVVTSFSDITLFSLRNWNIENNNRIEASRWFIESQ